MSKLAEATTNLFNSQTFKFLQESIQLLEHLNNMLDNANILMSDDSKLKENSYEYRWLYSLRKIVEEHTHDPERIVSILLTERNEQNVPHIQIISKYNKDLAEALLKHKATRKKDVDIVRMVLSLVSDVQKLIANIDIVLENIQVLKEDEQQGKIKQRAFLIAKFLEEIKVIELCLSDLESWIRYFNEDISFFGKSVELYIKGGFGKYNRQFYGLARFGDNTLINSIMNNPEVHALLQQSNVSAQIKYIQVLISYLQKDIDIKENIWLRNEATKIFYKNIEKHATAFAKSFNNERFAKLILENKDRIGEEPFAWIDFLKSLIQELKPLIEEKNLIVEKARNSLILIFRNREQSLRKSIETLAMQISEIIRQYGVDTDILKIINKGLRKIEKVLSKLWNERLAKFIKIKGRIEIINFNTKPELDKLLEKTNLKNEAYKIAVRTRAFIEFSKHKNELMNRVKKFDSRYIPHLFMVNFDLARMEDMAREVQLVQNLVVEKTKSLEQYNLNPLKEAISKLIQLYSILIEWLIYIGIKMKNVDLLNTKEQIKKFKDIYFGSII